MRNYPDDPEQLPDQLSRLSRAADVSRLSEVTALARQVGQRRLRQRRAGAAVGGLLVATLAAIPVGVMLRSEPDSIQAAGSGWAAVSGTPRGDLSARSDLIDRAREAWNEARGTHKDVRVVFAGTLPSRTGRVVVLAGTDGEGAQRLSVLGDDVAPSERAVDKVALLHDLAAPASEQGALAVVFVGAQPEEQLDQPVLVLLAVGAPGTESARWASEAGGGEMARLAAGVFAAALSAPDALGARVTLDPTTATSVIVPVPPEGADVAPATS